MLASFPNAMEEFLSIPLYLTSSVHSWYLLPFLLLQGAGVSVACPQRDVCYNILLYGRAGQLESIYGAVYSAENKEFIEYCIWKYKPVT